MMKPTVQEVIDTLSDAWECPESAKMLADRIESEGIAPPDGSKFMGFDVVVNHFLPPEGYALVPLEPTAEMLNAAIDAHGYKLCEISSLGIRRSPQWMFEVSYKAMLAAAEIGRTK